MGNQKRLDKVIEDARLDDKTPEEIETFLASLSGMAARQKRRRIRYIMARIQTQERGGPAAPEEAEEVRAAYEGKQGFDGWLNYGVTWDLSLEDPDVIVSRKYSQAEEWERVMRAKFPMILPGGNIVYPDAKVKEAVEANAKG